jgi:hypothetical protein
MLPLDPHKGTKKDMTYYRNPSDPSDPSDLTENDSVLPIEASDPSENQDSDSDTAEVKALKRLIESPPPPRPKSEKSLQGGNSETE